MKHLWFQVPHVTQILSRHGTLRQSIIMLSIFHTELSMVQMFINFPRALRAWKVHALQEAISLFQIQCDSNPS